MHGRQGDGACAVAAEAGVLCDADRRAQVDDAAAAGVDRSSNAEAGGGCGHHAAREAGDIAGIIAQGHAPYVVERGDTANAVVAAEQRDLVAAGTSGHIEGVGREIAGHLNRGAIGRVTDGDAVLADGCQAEPTRLQHGEITRATDVLHSECRRSSSPVNQQGGVVDNHPSAQAAAGGAGADPEGASVDGGSAAVGVVAGEDLGAIANLGDGGGAAGVGDHAIEAARTSGYTNGDGPGVGIGLTGDQLRAGDAAAAIEGIDIDTGIGEGEATSHRRAAVAKVERGTRVNRQ